MSVDGTVCNNVSFNPSFQIQQNEQNSLKGVLWVSAGSSLTAASLSLTAASAGALALTTLAVLSGSESTYFTPAKMLALTLATGAVNYISVKFTGFCFSNAIHHFGPEYTIIRQE
jgi:hypothetical protein